MDDVFADLNETLVLDGRLRILAVPELSLDVIDVREPANEKLAQLELNEELRLATWNHLFPLLLFALVFYLLLAALWLFYNVRAYRRQKEEFERNLANRQVESSRRLEFYKQIPVEKAESGEEVELVEEVAIHDPQRAEAGSP
ncbi:hypothetical protein M3Y99_00539200 [Aphelenchoides fujianensis]|nr:hypothetical protein M3Y99_00539200 [Aphelenchoides fujianensis]